MKIYDVSRLPSSIALGWDGENNWRPIAFDCSALLAGHPDGVVTLWLLPKGETQAFPVTLSRDGNTVVWTPLNEEMTAEHGQLQIVVQDSTDVGKSKVVDYSVHDSLVGGADHPAETPSWATQVVADVTEQADRAEEAAESIGESIGEQLPGAIADYLEEHPVTVTEIDPTVPSWAKQPNKPTYTAAEVGALPDSYTPPVQSVNGKTGVVVLDAEDVGALPDDTVIPAAVTEQTVAGWGFTKNTGTYSKPSGGIPASDLAAGVIPDVSGKQDVPLVGQAYDDTADDYLTPTQVRAAISAEKDVIITARDVFDELPIQLTFTDFTVVCDRLNVQISSVVNAVIAHAVTRFGNDWYMYSLIGTITYGGQTVNSWSIVYGALPLDFDPSSLAAVATSGSYDDLTDKPSIPSLSGYATEQWVENKGYLTQHQDISGKADKIVVTASDNGKFMRVVNGAWAAVEVPDAESASFGGGS